MEPRPEIIQALNVAYLGYRDQCSLSTITDCSVVMAHTTVIHITYSSIHTIVV